MYDRLLKLDLDKVKKSMLSPSFVVFHDGRTVVADDFGHSQTVLKTCKKHYPEWIDKFKQDFKKLQPDIDVDDKSQDDLDSQSDLLVVSNPYLENHGFVIIHRIPIVGLMIFGFPKMTKKQIKAIDKINAVFKVDMWPDFYIEKDVI